MKEEKIELKETKEENKVKNKKVLIILEIVLLMLFAIGVYAVMYYENEIRLSSRAFKLNDRDIRPAYNSELEYFMDKKLSKNAYETLKNIANRKILFNNNIENVEYNKEMKILPIYKYGNLSMGYISAFIIDNDNEFNKQFEPYYYPYKEIEKYKELKELAQKNNMHGLDKYEYEDINETVIYPIYNNEGQIIDIGIDSRERDMDLKIKNYGEIISSYLGRKLTSWEYKKFINTMKENNIKWDEDDLPTSLDFYKTIEVYYMGCYMENDEFILDFSTNIQNSFVFIIIILDVIIFISILVILYKLRQTKWFKIFIVLLLLEFIILVLCFAIMVFFAGNKIIMSVDKPIIYIYPEEEKEVEVKLGYPDSITCSYPKYEYEGWKVLAKPSGDLIDLESKRELYSLYYENESNIEFKQEKEGFVVKSEDVAKFLEEKLEILGLNEREAQEFIIYWLPKLEENKYNYIRFASMDEINANMPIDIQPNPDTIIRVLMTYKGLDKEIEVEEQKLTTPQRKGYTVVEWGGTEIK